MLRLSARRRKSWRIACGRTLVQYGKHKASIASNPEYSDGTPVARSRLRAVVTPLGEGVSVPRRIFRVRFRCFNSEWQPPDFRPLHGLLLASGPLRKWPECWVPICPPHVVRDRGSALVARTGTGTTYCQCLPWAQKGPLEKPSLGSGSCGYVRIRVIAPDVAGPPTSGYSSFIRHTVRKHVQTGFSLLRDAYKL